MKTATIVTDNNTAYVYTSDAGLRWTGPTDHMHSVAIAYGYYIKAEMTKEIYDLNVKIAEEGIAHLFDLGILR